MKRVFICSPYRGDVERNVAVARTACRDVLLAGDAPFAPHLLYPAILDDQDAAQRECGIAAGVAWLAAADEILVVGEPTEGMRAEIAAATALGLRVRRASAIALLVLAVLAGAGCVGAGRDAGVPPRIEPETPT